MTAEARLLALELLGYSERAQPRYRVTDLDSGDVLAEGTSEPTREAALGLQLRGFSEGTLMAFYSTARRPLWVVRVGAGLKKDLPVAEVTIAEVLAPTMPTRGSAAPGSHHATDEVLDGRRRP